FEKARGDNLAFAADVDPESEGQQRLDRLAKVVRQRSNISVRTANLSDWDNEIDRIHNLLVKSLAHLEGSIPWRRDVLEESLQPFKKIADPDLILFAEADGETIGWFPGIRNLNEVLIKVNGLRYPWNYLTLLTGLRRQTDCLSVKSLLVLPEYWNHGVGILLFDELAKRAHAKGYKWVDLSLTGEDNPQTPYIAGKIGARIYKRYRIYRKTL
ncbi:MAG: GNAT family N-acetyltransferase, partial [Spirochaetales bacterium]|nr:GNAT family N-acetyltransferase [Spirochaetales bacterium]